MPREWMTRPSLALCGLLVLNAVLWGPTLRCGFVFDDLVNIVGNPWIRDWGELPRAFLGHAAGFDPGFHTSFYRPAMHAIYAVAYALAGPQPWAFHLVNLVFHTSNVLLVYVLTRALVERLGRRFDPKLLPFVAAVVFSVHPVHTEPVAWIAGVTDLSYTFFGLSALVVYVRSFRLPRLAIGAGALIFIGLLSKETAAAIVIVMLLLEALEAGSDRAWSIRAAALRLAPAAAASVLYLVLRITALESLAPSAVAHPHGLGNLVSAAAGLMARYIGLLVAPIRLDAMRMIPVDAGFGDPAVLAGMVVGVALVVLAVRFRRSPLPLLAISVAVLPILPVLYVPSIEGGASLLGERYLYLPVLGVGWGLGLVLDAMRRRRAWGTRASIAVFGGIVLASAPVVIARSRVWSDSLRLWTDAVEKSPDNAASHEGLCFALYDAGRFEEALASCERAITLDPSRVDARINRATALLASGRASQALAEFDSLLALRPDDAGALVNRGLACMALGRFDEAVRSYRRALAVHPRFAEAHNVLGVALYRSGRRDEGLRHIEEAVRLAPDNAEYRENLEAGRGGEAEP